MAPPDKDIPLILASASPRRIELLRMLGAKFEVMPSDIEEDTIIRGAIRKLVLYRPA